MPRLDITLWNGAYVRTATTCYSIWTYSNFQLQATILMGTELIITRLIHEKERSGYIDTADKFKQIEFNKVYPKLTEGMRGVR